MEWQLAPDIKSRLDRLLKADIFPHIQPLQITAMRGTGSKGRAIARIWSFPKPWQIALEIGPRYIIEVIAEHFDKLSASDKDRTLIHELMHIPKNFSGALLSHRHHSQNINRRSVDDLYKKFYDNCSSR
ncbi:MAG: putative metallopeptidase [Patescibacteria group bacterium]